MSDISDLPLYQIVGAPLLALVQGEAQAAQTTARFIQEIGFESTASPTASTDASQTGNKMGNLRMVSFRYSKTSVGGAVSWYEIDIPVLSIVPIPALQIKEADLEFAVEISSAINLAASTPVSTEDQKDLPSSDQALKKDSSLSPEILAFKGGLAREDSKSSIKIKIKACQADTPVGLLTIFRTLDHGIASREVGS